MKSFGIVIAPHIPKALEMAVPLLAWCETRGVQPRISEEAAHLLARPELASPNREMACNECVVILGGDGSVLMAARDVAPKGVPILSVELGEFGFLSEVTPEQLLHAMEKLLSQEYHVEERLMVDVRVRRGGREVERSLGLNDAVITKSAIARMIRLYTTVNDEFVSDYPADGLIIATPTGSTAYSLSAGGPVVHPHVEALILTPICAHTLFTRPLIVSATETIRVQTDFSPSHHPAEVMLTIDGQVGIELQPGDAVTVAAADTRARFIKIWQNRFYERLQKKMKWGGES